MGLTSGTVADIVIGSAAAVSGTILGVKKWKDRRAQKRSGIQANPARCIDHEDRLRKVETICTAVGPKLEAIQGDITDIKGSVKTLIDIHLKQ